jgi:large subunit ribosomal protein L4
LPTINLFNLEKKVVGSMELNDRIFSAEEKPVLYYEVIRMQLAKRRAGTAFARDRGEVAFSTKKLFRQKGTGNARRGSRRDPLLRKGGTIHGPRPRDYEYLVPKKVRKGALRSALSTRLREERLFVVDTMAIDWISTKRALTHLERFGDGPILVVDVDNANLWKSVRNAVDCKFLPARGVNLFDVLNHDAVVVSKAAVNYLEGVLGHDR